MKQCTKCLKQKPYSDFHKKKQINDGYAYHCKECVRSYDSKEHDSKRVYPKKYLDGKMHCRSCNEYFDKDKFTMRKGNTARCNDCAILYQHTRTVKKHGITYDKYLEIFNSQNGKCKICKLEEQSYRSRLSIDHDHACCPGYNSCGKCIRGLLCSSCNMILGNAKDNVDILKAAIKYLQK